MGSKCAQNSFAKELFDTFKPMKNDIKKVVVTVEDQNGNRVVKELTAQEFLNALNNKGDKHEKTR